MSEAIGARAELEVDAGPLGEIELGGRLDLFGHQLDEVTRTLEQLRWGLRPKIKRKIRAERVLPNPAPTFAFFDLGGPKENGRAWDVMRYVVALADPSAAAGAAVSWCYVGTAQPQDTSIEPAWFPDLVDQGRAIQTLVGWSDDQVTLYWPEHLIFVVKGAANSAAISVTGQVLEYGIEPIEGQDDPLYTEAGKLRYYRQQRATLHPTP